MSSLTSPSAPPADAAAASAASIFLKPFERLERAAAESQPSWVFPLRKAGLARFAELGLPTLRHEDWRYTNVAPLQAQPFAPALAGPLAAAPEHLLARAPLAALPGDRLVFVDGHFLPALSRLTAHTGGVIVLPLAQALKHHGPLIEKHLGRYARSEVSAFTALNDAYFTDGAFIQVPAGQVIADPVQLVFVSTGAQPGAASHPRNLILAGAGSQLTVVENYLGPAEASYLTNAVTEIVAGDNAVLEHLKLQDESRSAWHVAAVQASLGRASNVVLHSFALGARLSRHNINTTLDGEGLECVLNGLYLTDGEQLADHHMVVDHARPHCASHEYFNGILEGRSRAVFHGRILVRKHAQKTDAKQTNKNMLLSDEATVDTKPQLEIYADDVKCTHGATIGQLHPEHIFYLRARGIPLETARRMLIHAFAGEIIDRVRCAPAREELDQLIWDRLELHANVQIGAHH